MKSLNKIKLCLALKIPPRKIKILKDQHNWWSADLRREAMFGVPLHFIEKRHFIFDKDDFVYQATPNGLGFNCNLEELYNYVKKRTIEILE